MFTSMSIYGNSVLADLLEAIDTLAKPSVDTNLVRSTGLVERTTSNNEKLVHEIELPGVKPVDVSVTVTGARLDVVAKRSTGDVKRTYTLSETLDPDGCTAKLENGVLAVAFPFRGKQKQEPRKIIVSY